MLVSLPHCELSYQLIMMVKYGQLVISVCKKSAKTGSVIETGIWNNLILRKAFHDSISQGIRT